MLPTKKTPKKSDVRDLTVFVYGPPKIGKSTFCSGADGALFLATEPGLNHLEVFQAPVGSWAQLLGAAADLAKNNHEFRTVVVDTIDNAYRMCMDYICADNGWKHPDDGGKFGKGFGLVNREFQRVMTKLASLPYGLMLVSHSVEREEETRTGKKLKTMPTLPPSARLVALGLCDMILYADVDGDSDRRIIRTKPSDRYEAGDRTGRLPATLPLDYATFVAAFRGEAKEERGEE